MADSPMRPNRSGTSRDSTVGQSLERWGNYVVIRYVGRTGPVDVYQALEESLDRRVAVKVLIPELAKDADTVSRFRTEAVAAARVSHANVLPIYFVGEDAGRWYFATQWPSGESLRARIDRGYQFSIESTVDVVAQCLAGLNALHAQGRVHGGIDAESIFLEEHSNRLLLADAGLARVSGSSREDSAGSLQAAVTRSADQGQGADLYAVGELILEICTGYPAELVSIDQAFPLEENAVDAGPSLRNVVERLMADGGTAPFADCQSALDAVLALKRSLADRDSTADDGQASHAKSPRAEKPHRRLRSRLKIAGFAILLVMLAAACIARWRASQVDRTEIKSARVLLNAPQPASDSITPPGDSNTTAPTAKVENTPEVPENPQFGRPVVRLLSAADGSAASSAGLAGLEAAPPPNMLRFAGKHCLEMGLLEIEPEWMEGSYSFTLTERSSGKTGSHRLMGNLDTRPDGESKAGWALLQVNGELAAQANAVASSPGKSSSQSRLAFAYRTTGGKIRQIVGGPFDLNDQWLEITITHPRGSEGISVYLDGRRYMEFPATGISTSPCIRQFWVGCPAFAAEPFFGDIRGFAFHRAVHAKARPYIMDSDTAVLLDLSHPQSNLALDLSGSGYHAAMIGCEWARISEATPPPAEVLTAPEGMAYAVELGRNGCVEVLGTQKLVSLTSTFTAEMWFRFSAKPRDFVFMGTWAHSKGDTGATVDYGWAVQTSTHDLGISVCFNGGFGMSNEISSGTLITRDRRWHHLAFCNAKDHRQFYLDGQPLLKNESEATNLILEYAQPSPLNLFLGRCLREPDNCNMQIRGFRLDGTFRYTEAFTPPAELGVGPKTLVSLDFSHVSADPYIEDLSPAGRKGLRVLAPWYEVKKKWGP